MLGEEKLRTIEEITNQLIGHPESEPFRLPIDWKLFGWKDYPELIPHPMDLGSIKRRVQRKEYRSESEWVEDVNQVFDNCRAYFQDYSKTAKFGTSVEAFWHKALERHAGLKSLLEKEASKKEVLKELGEICRNKAGSLDKVVELIKGQAPAAVKTNSEEVVVNFETVPLAMLKNLRRQARTFA